MRGYVIIIIIITKTRVCKVTDLKPHRWVVME